jgi:hypothetical protein
VFLAEAFLQGSLDGTGDFTVLDEIVLLQGNYASIWV